MSLYIQRVMEATSVAEVLELFGVFAAVLEALARWVFSAGASAAEVVEESTVAIAAVASGVRGM